MTAKACRAGEPARHSIGYLLLQSLGARDVDASLAVERIGAGLAEVVGGLLQNRFDLRRLVVADVLDDERGEAGPVRRGHARPGPADHERSRAAAPGPRHGWSPRR